ncbi:Dabb family protein [Nakamurella leprariae]|uniref:Dabb family protein n=1 Tax=Nakamurella leprariae TaxID=2803911 RepID=A0A938YJA0_9ACTN|nr:Dabb family protein [Nakamurella leprariae]MBM9468888.1 Dabb family protein [Nakamurella leprariae]
MIRHIFMWQAAAPEERQPVLDLLVQLSDRLPMIKSWELGGHQGEPNDNGDPWDGALITDFASWEDLEAYSIDPFHNEIVAQLLPRVRSRAVVDFVRDGAAQ